MSEVLSIEEKQVLRKFDGGRVDEAVDGKWDEGTGGEEGGKLWSLCKINWNI